MLLAVVGAAERILTVQVERVVIQEVEVEVAKMEGGMTKKEVMEPDPKCELCDGSGWEFVAWTDPRTGDSIEAVKRCSCRSLVVVDRKDEVGSLADF